MPRNPRALLTPGRGVAALATVAAVLSVPVVTHSGIVPAHAETVPSDDLTKDGTTPDPAPAPEAGPGSFDDLTNEASAPPPGTDSGTVPDDLSNDGTTPDPAPAPEPGPGTPDDLTNDGTTPPPAPAPGTPGDDLSNDGTTPPPAPA